MPNRHRLIGQPQYWQSISHHHHPAKISWVMVMPCYLPLGRALSTGVLGPCCKDHIGLQLLFRILYKGLYGIFRPER